MVTPWTIQAYDNDIKYLGVIELEIEPKSSAAKLNFTI